MIAISNRPPTSSASANCQPIKIQITAPSSSDEIGRGELKGEGARGRGALGEQRLGDRHGAYEHEEEAAPSAVARPTGLAPLATERSRDAFARNPGLDDRRDREPEDERPPDRPGHQQGVGKGLPRSSASSSLREAGDADRQLARFICRIYPTGVRRGTGGSPAPDAPPAEKAVPSCGISRPSKSGDPPLPIGRGGQRKEGSHAQRSRASRKPRATRDCSGRSSWSC